MLMIYIQVIGCGIGIIPAIVLGLLLRKYPHSRNVAMSAITEWFAKAEILEIFKRQVKNVSFLPGSG